MIGRKIIEQKITSNKTTLNIAQLDRGVYIVEVKMKNGMSVKKKLVKE
jgi:hypothetical protein